MNIQKQFWAQKVFWEQLYGYSPDLVLLESALKQGANPYQPRGEAPTPIEFAIAQCPSVLPILVKYIDINHNIMDGVTPLIMAVMYDNIEAIKILLAAKPNLDAQDGFGCTALFRSTHRESPTIALMLLEAGANPEIEDNFESNFWDNVAHIKKVGMKEQWQNFDALYEQMKLNKIAGIQDEDSEGNINIL